MPGSDFRRAPGQSPALPPTDADGEITDADLSKACSDAARVLTPKAVMGYLATFGAKQAGELHASERRRFLDGLKAMKEGEELPQFSIVAEPRPSPPENVRRLMEAYEGLEIDQHGNLDGGSAWVFRKLNRDFDVPLPPTLPSITHGDSVYFLLPDDLVPDYWQCSPLIEAKIATEGDVFVPPEDWPEDPKIIDALDKYNNDVLDARNLRRANELLAAERTSTAGLFASAVEIDEAAPMLVDGLLRERGVSVIYGDMDEFKTTLVLDMMAHVAVGAPWQGHKVMARPVLWYALEDASEIPVRLKALEARFQGKDTPWGHERLPITVRDRIPEDYRKWRAEIESIAYRWAEIYEARQTAGELPIKTVEHPNGGTFERPRYPCPDDFGWRLAIVIDTLSMALGGEDEKGPRAVEFVSRCLDLLKEQPDMARPFFGSSEEEEDWEEQHPGEGYNLDSPVALHVIIIHHQTKTGTDFAGHRAIGANTQGLYRVHRFGKMDDANRPYAGMLTPKRTKDMARPAPLRFEVAIVDVPGTKRTAAILKDRATDIPKELKPAIDALRELENPEPISPTELNECLDEVKAVGGATEGVAKRKARQRCREKLEAAGVIEPVEEDGKPAFYRFHDPRTV